MQDAGNGLVVLILEEKELQRLLFFLWQRVDGVARRLYLTAEALALLEELVVLVAPLDAPVGRAFDARELAFAAAFAASRLPCALSSCVSYSSLLISPLASFLFRSSTAAL